MNCSLQNKSAKIMPFSSFPTNESDNDTQTQGATESNN